MIEMWKLGGKTNEKMGRKCHCVEANLEDTGLKKGMKELIRVIDNGRPTSI